MSLIELEEIYCGYALDFSKTIDPAFESDKIEKVYSIETIPITQHIENNYVGVEGCWRMGREYSTSFFGPNDFDREIELKYGKVIYSPDINICKDFVEKMKRQNEEVISNIKVAIDKFEALTNSTK